MYQPLHKSPEAVSAKGGGKLPPDPAAPLFRFYELHGMAAAGPVILLQKMISKKAESGPRPAMPIAKPVHRQAVGNLRNAVNEFPSGVLMAAAGTVPEVGRTVAVNLKANSDLNDHGGNFSIDAQKMSLFEFESRHHVLRPMIGHSFVMPALARWTDSRAAGTISRSHQPDGLRAGLPGQTADRGMNRYATTRQDGFSGLPLPPETSISRGLWPFISDLSPSLRTKSLANNNDISNLPWMDQNFREMPLVYKLVGNIRQSANPGRQIQRREASVRLEPLPLNAATAVADDLRPLRTAETPAAPVTQAASTESRINFDEMVEKLWPKIMRKLTIEQERRGYSSWI